MYYSVNNMEGLVTMSKKCNNSQLYPNSRVVTIKQAGDLFFLASIAMIN